MFTYWHTLLKSTGSVHPMAGTILISLALVLTET